jgi:hypothetical protein
MVESIVQKSQATNIDRKPFMIYPDMKFKIIWDNFMIL